MNEAEARLLREIAERQIRTVRLEQRERDCRRCVAVGVAFLVVLLMVALLV